MLDFEYNEDLVTPERLEYHTEWMIKHLEKGLIPHLKELKDDIKDDLKNIKGFIN